MFSLPLLQEGFSGFACQECKDPNFYGEKCNKGGELENKRHTEFLPSVLTAQSLSLFACVCVCTRAQNATVRTECVTVVQTATDSVFASRRTAGLAVIKVRPRKQPSDVLHKKKTSLTHSLGKSIDVTCTLH